MFNTKPLPADVDVLAPDMSEIRVLLSVEGASMAHGTLSPGCVSLTIRHRTVEEIWYVVGGEGEIWRKHGDREEIVRLRAGVCITIPVGTIFQFRTIGDRPSASSCARSHPGRGRMRQFANPITGLSRMSDDASPAAIRSRARFRSTRDRVW